MKRIFTALVWLVFPGLILAGCETLSYSEKRIRKNPAMYERLSERDQQLVLQGEVKEGMSRDAVFLSWGRPGMVQSGSREGTGKEIWTYFGSTPVQTSTIGFGTGGYPPYGPSPFYSHYGCHPTYGYGYGTSVDYIPHIERTVEFANDRVIAWERRR